MRDVLHKEGVFKVRAKSENYQGESKVRYSIADFHPMDYAQEAHHLSGLIDQYIAVM